MRRSALFDEAVISTEGDVVGVGLETDPARPNYDNWLMVPEVVFARIIGIAGAYRLQLLPVLDVYGDHVLNPDQAERLADELETIVELINDPLVHKYAISISDVAQRCRRTVSGKAQVMMIEGP